MLCYPASTHVWCGGILLLFFALTHELHRYIGDASGDINQCVVCATSRENYSFQRYHEHFAVYVLSVRDWRRMLAGLGDYGESSACHCGECGDIPISSGDFGHEAVCCHHETRTHLVGKIRKEHDFIICTCNFRRFNVT